MPLSETAATKRERMSRLANASGVIAALALDQRKSLRAMMGPVTDAQVVEFKAAVTEALSPYASAILLDLDYGLEASRWRAPGCGLLLAYESDPFENPRPHKMLALVPGCSAVRLGELGADGVKILLSYTPFDDPRANEKKHTLIERIGQECEAAGLPFLLEPVAYDPGGLDLKGFDFSTRKPEIVIRSMEEFSKDRYHVDILKVEFPVNASFVEGSTVFSGRAAFSRAEALDIFQRADAVARRPYIYLSAGVRAEHFLESIALATEAGARYSGVLCGRATWQDAVPIFLREGRAALEAWLRTEGVRNIQAVNASLKSATPWHRRAG